MKKLLRGSDEARRILATNIYMMSGLNQINVTLSRMEITPHILQNLFLTLMSIVFGPAVLAALYLSYFDLSDAPLWAEIIIYMVGILFTLALVTHGWKPYTQPSKLIFDREFERIIFQNPMKKHYIGDKLWPEELSVKDIKNFAIYETRNVDSRKSSYIFVITLQNDEPLLIFSTSNEDTREQVRDYIGIQLGIEELHAS